MEQPAPAGSRMDQLLNRLRNDVIGIREQGDELSKQMWLLHVTFEDFMHIHHPERSKQLMQTSLNVDDWIDKPSKTRSCEQIPHQQQIDLEKLDGTVSPKRRIRNLRMLKERKYDQKKNYVDCNNSHTNEFQCDITGDINSHLLKDLSSNELERTESTHDKFAVCSDSKYKRIPDTTTQIHCQDAIVQHTTFERTSRKGNHSSNPSDDSSDECEFVTSFTREPVDLRIARKTKVSARKSEESVSQQTQATSRQTFNDYRDISCPHRPQYSTVTISSGYNSGQDDCIAYNEVSDRLLCRENVRNQISLDCEEKDEADDNNMILAEDRYKKTNVIPKKCHLSHQPRHRKKSLYVSEQIQNLNDNQTCQVSITNMNSTMVPVSTESISQPYDSGRSSMSDSLCDVDNIDDLSAVTLLSSSLTSPHRIYRQPSHHKTSAFCESLTDDSKNRMSYDSASLYENEAHIYMTIADDSDEISLTPKCTPPPALPPRNFAHTSKCDKNMSLKNTYNQDIEDSMFRHLRGVRSDRKKAANIYTASTPTSTRNEESGFVMGAKYIPALFSPEANSNERSRSHSAYGYSSDERGQQDAVYQLNQLNLSHCPAEVKARSTNSLSRCIGTKTMNLTTLVNNYHDSWEGLVNPSSSQLKSGSMSGDLSSSYRRHQPANRGTLTQQWAAALPMNIHNETYC